VCLLLTASITGSIISATVLRGNTSSSVTSLVDDVTLMTSCGAGYCPWYNSTNPNLDKPPQSTVGYSLYTADY